MVKVTYHREYNRLTVTGHAGAAPVGQDLVCASVSILTLTLAENVRNMAQCGIVRNPIIEIADGNAEISFKTKSGFKSIAMQTFQAVVVGYEILATKFPENISFEILG